MILVLKLTFVGMTSLIISLPTIYTMAQEEPISTVERNKDLVQSYYRQVFNNHNLSTVDRYVDTNITEHNPALAPGIEKFKQVYSTLTSFPIHTQRLNIF